MLYLKKNNFDLEMLIHEDSPRDGHTTPNIKITFMGGKVIEGDGSNFNFKHHALEDGTRYKSCCQWTDNELYNTADGYEAHMRLTSGNLTIACRDIVPEYDVGDEGLINC